MRGFLSRGCPVPCQLLRRLPHSPPRSHRLPCPVFTAKLLVPEATFALPTTSCRGRSPALARAARRLEHRPRPAGPRVCSGPRAAPGGRCDARRPGLAGQPGHCLLPIVSLCPPSTPYGGDRNPQVTVNDDNRVRDPAMILSEADLYLLICPSDWVPVHPLLLHILS